MGESGLPLRYNCKRHFIWDANQVKGIFAEIKFIHTDLYVYSYFGSGNQSDNADGGFNSYGRCHIIKHVNVNLFSVFPDDSDVYGSVH
mgnify:CR=1 FL=1